MQCTFPICLQNPKLVLDSPPSPTPPLMQCTFSPYACKTLDLYLAFSKKPPPPFPPSLFLSLKLYRPNWDSIFTPLEKLVLCMAAHPVEARRADSAFQHVRALNTQFASWVQSQLLNHPDELWQDGVQDYLNHASHIMDKFRDVVDWLKACSEKNDGSVLPLVGNNLPIVARNEPNFQVINGNSMLPTFTGSTMTTTSSWNFNLVPNNQRSALPGSQSFAPEAETSEDLIEESEQPSSPSVKKTEEKGIIVVHEAKCKVYVKPDDPREKGWKDIGVGQLSIKCNEGANKATRESKPTVVVRNDVGKALLNALIYPGIKMNVQKNAITTIFHTVGAGSNEAGKDAVVMARTYLLRLKTEDDTNKLATAIKEFEPAA